MLKHTILSLMLCGLAVATESFDHMSTGGVTNATLSIGALTAQKGHAEIYGKGHGDSRSLHIAGGENKSATITFATPTAKETAIDFYNYYNGTVEYCDLYIGSDAIRYTREEAQALHDAFNPRWSEQSKEETAEKEAELTAKLRNYMNSGNTK